MPTLIRYYQIDLPGISGYIQSVATSSGVSNSYYPSNSNPSGYITPNQTGQFQPAGSYVQTSQSGQFYSNSNPSGFVTSIQTGNLTGQFYPLNSNPSSYVPSSATGNFLTQSVTDTLYYSINNPSGFITGISTGNLTGQFYPLNSNPSGYLNSGKLIAGSGISILNSGGNLIFTSSGNTGNNAGTLTLGANASGYISLSGNQINLTNVVNGSGGFSTINANIYYAFGSSPNININLALGNYFVVNFSGASGVASLNPTFSFVNVVGGSNCIIEVIQNAATGLSCIFPSGTLQAGGGGNTYVATGINFIDILALAFKDSGHARIAITRNYS